MDEPDEKDNNRRDEHEGDENDDSERIIFVNRPNFSSDEILSQLHIDWKHWINTWDFRFYLYFRSNFSDDSPHLVHHIHCLGEVIEEVVKQLWPVWLNEKYG